MGERDVAPRPVVETRKVVAAFEQGEHRFFHGPACSSLISSQCARVDPADQGQIRPEGTAKRGVSHAGTFDVAYPEAVDASLDQRR